MFTETIQTRFSDMDGLGHINNAMIPVWFEGARDPIFKMFMPDLDLSGWSLILAKINVDFHQETHYGQPVEVRSFIARIGRSSFDVYQEIWQDGAITASGTAVMVHFDYQSKSSKRIPDEIKAQLEAHLRENVD